MIIVAVASKSALSILHVWLPLAMEGPTPVSALIHAATLVTVGVFVGIRLRLHLTTGLGVYLLLSSCVLSVVLVALLSAAQLDLKRTVAYSTLITVGFGLYSAVSTGSSVNAALTLMVHAVFKATLFMLVGLYVHECNEQDARRVSQGGLPQSLGHGMLNLLSILLGLGSTIGAWKEGI
jgi:NADH:ubiquinone oxidoreductase subunit 5 (subunit L)/multisubunit Na+/H+ antiporter MnhA subunit